MEHIILTILVVMNLQHLVLEVQVHLTVYLVRLLREQVEVVVVDVPLELQEEQEDLVMVEQVEMIHKVVHLPLQTLVAVVGAQVKTFQVVLQEEQEVQE